MHVLITGADGFIGRNLRAQLLACKEIEISTFTKAQSSADLFEKVKNADFIIHLAGVNRPQNNDEFKHGNTYLTHDLCEAITCANKKIPVIYTSSTQALLSNPYGESKRDAEELLRVFAQKNNSPVYNYRLANVFGKWARPNYNSVIATFCYNTIHNLPIQINNPDAELNLIYIDDVVERFITLIKSQVTNGFHSCSVEPVYHTTVQNLACQIQAFRHSRDSLVTDAVGTGLVRALYSTYVSYLPTELFSYPVPEYRDPRGVFVEMLKTKDSGQFSFFTAPPGITRGGHYHHSKTEKFLVIKGNARFRFRHIITQEFYELATEGARPEIVETVPGWTHDITNIGSDEMIVMLWANELFDREHPDTYACEL